MTAKKANIDRRNFLKTAGTAGVASVLASTPQLAGAEKQPAEPNQPDQKQKFKLPHRKLGKTGVKVPILNLGGIFNIEENQIVLQKAVEWGVTYLDTAHGYTGGTSERGIGMYLKKNPDIRKELFIVSKASGARDTDGMESRLKTSLERMNTDYIDLYYIHGLGNPDQLNDDVRKWAESAKKRGLIRFFGFSTHRNMARCMTAASKLDWIDTIMTKYDFRLMQEPEMNEAVEACYKSGVGLVAMKTQSGGPIKPDAEEDQKLGGHFLKRGFSEYQAKLKVIWQDKRIATICSQMETISKLGANVAAALDKTELTPEDIEKLQEFSRATCDGYCAGCSEICEHALPRPEGAYICDVMRYLMYHNSYGDQHRARELFAQIPRSVRSRLTQLDYSAAEARCPQHLPIGKLMAQAVKTLA